MSEQQPFEKLAYKDEIPRTHVEVPVSRQLAENFQDSLIGMLKHQVSQGLRDESGNLIPDEYGNTKTDVVTRMMASVSLAKNGDKSHVALCGTELKDFTHEYNDYLGQGEFSPIEVAGLKSAVNTLYTSFNSARKVKYGKKSLTIPLPYPEAAFDHMSQHQRDIQYKTQNDVTIDTEVLRELQRLVEVDIADTISKGITVAKDSEFEDPKLDILKRIKKAKNSKDHGVSVLKLSEQDITLLLNIAQLYHAGMNDGMIQKMGQEFASLKMQNAKMENEKSRSFVSKLNLVKRVK